MILISASEGDKELVQDEFTPTGSKNWRVVSCTVVDSLAKLVLYERRPVFAETLAVGAAGVASPVHSSIFDFQDRKRCIPFPRKLIRTISALFAFNSSNSNRIWSSRELIIFSDSNFWCVWSTCAVCCGPFSHEARHTARTQHSTGTQHSQIKVLCVFFSLSRKWFEGGHKC